MITSKCGLIDLDHHHMELSDMLSEAVMALLCYLDDGLL